MVIYYYVIIDYWNIIVIYINKRLLIVILLYPIKLNTTIDLFNVIRDFVCGLSLFFSLYHYLFLKVLLIFTICHFEIFIYIMEFLLFKLSLLKQ